MRFVDGGDRLLYKDRRRRRPPLIVHLSNETYYGTLPEQPLQNFRPLPVTKLKECKKKNIDSIQDSLMSQQGEDKLLLRLFNGLCQGSYMELGALDGKTFSNTFVFHREFQWRGVLVELTPEQYAKLVRHRPDELATVQAVVCPPGQSVHVVTGHDAVSGVWEWASPAFRQRWWNDIDDVDELETVSCTSLQDILDQHVSPMDTDSHSSSSYYFDIFSLDVEGGEWNVLQTIDWDRTQFGLVLVEAPDHKQDDKERILKYLPQKGYSFKGEKNGSLWFLHDFFDDIYNELIG